MRTGGRIRITPEERRSSRLGFTLLRQTFHTSYFKVFTDMKLDPSADRSDT